MPDDSFPELTPELLQEFYTEADEHLAKIRECLLGLEPYAESAQVDAVLADELFRNFHSFKGNSALVGLRPAEGIAHAAEDYLRQLVRGQLTLTDGALDVLMMAAHELEQTVAAYREHRPVATPDGMLEKLRGLIGSNKSGDTPAPSPVAPSVHATASGDLASLTDQARAQGMTICEVLFLPSKDLDERGVNLNSVRGRLQALGQVLRVTPRVRPDSGIEFNFLMAIPTAPEDLAHWESDAVTFKPWKEETRSELPSAQLSTGTDPATELAPSSYIQPSQFVRVDLRRLDDLMRIAGDLVVHRARLEDQMERPSSSAKAEREGLQEVYVAIGRSIRELRDAIMRARLVPVGELFQRLPFVVRDLARETDLHVKVVTEGQDTEIDKYLIERLKDPLLHLVRNTVAHAIEPPDERIAQGKPPEATLRLAARAVGDLVVIEVSDDGRGVDARRVAERAALMGLPVPETLDSAGLLRLLCAPGFSTRNEADRGAGRGVGMAVVERTVRELGGTLRLQTEVGRGTRFVLRLPLTLAIADAFIVTAGEQTFALPQTFVTEVVEMRSDQVRRVQRGEFLPYRQSVLPLLRMTTILGRPPSSKGRLPVLVLSGEGATTGLVVDRVLGQREIVVRSLRDPLVQAAGFSGATELGDGRPVLILDTNALTTGFADVQPISDQELNSLNQVA